jgi:hypothetical protein
MQRDARVCLARCAVFSAYEKNVARTSVKACCNFMPEITENATKA